MKNIIPLLLALVVTTLVSADEVSPEQKKHAIELYRAGVVHYQSGDLEQAAREFKESFQSYPKAETLFNLAQTHRLLKHYEDAVFFYKQFLATATVREPQKTQIEKRISELEDLLKKQSRVQSAPPQEPAPSSTGSAPPIAVGESLQAPSLTAANPRSKRTRWYRSAAGWSLVGGSVALGAASAALLSVALSEGALARQATTQANFDYHHGRDLRFQQAGWPLLGVGIAAVVGGTIVFTLRARSGR